MLQHLSPRLFKERIADFDGAQKFHFINNIPCVILFRTEEHLLLKGFRDVYERISTEYPPARTFEVIEDEDPQIAAAYGIDEFPSTMFIRSDGQYRIINGFLSPLQAKEVVEKFLLKQE